MRQPAPGVAFTWSDDGDMRTDGKARRHVGERLGLASEWATVNQVHGGEVHVVRSPGVTPAGDALITTTRQLPLSILTADCLGVVFVAPEAVGVAHAGWRGLTEGILENTTETMRSLGFDPEIAYLGPAIGPCCFEVGDDVASVFPEDLATTTWGTTSVDLVSVARRQIGAPVESDGRCTLCDGGFSHRRDGNPSRMATLGWLS